MHYRDIGNFQYMTGNIYCIYGKFRVAMVREKYLENEMFSRSGNFVDHQGNLERTWKVKSGKSQGI